MLFTNRLRAYVLVVGATIFSAGVSIGQPPPTVGTYTYFWTDTAGTPITSAQVLPGETVTVQFRIQESGGGNAFVSGLGAYDTTVTWGLSGNGQNLLFFEETGGTNVENQRIRTNPYTAGGFNGPGAVTNGAVETINENRTLNVTRAVLSITNPATWVTQSTAPNPNTGSILLMELTFTATSNLGETTVVGGQRLNQDNYLYFLDDDFNEFYLDSTIGTTTATLNVAVVPEPASILGMCVAGAGLVGMVRRGINRRRQPVAA
jgi:hypothetical protein